MVRSRGRHVGGCDRGGAHHSRAGANLRYSCGPGEGCMRIKIATLLALSVSSATAVAQAPNGEALFTQHCAACHLNPVEDDIPNRAQMGEFAPNAIVESLTDGTMRLQGQALSQGERIAIAELLTGRPVLAASLPVPQGVCTASTPFAPSVGTAMERLGPRHAQHAPSARCRRPHGRERRQLEAPVGVRRRGRHAVALAARGRRRPLVHGQPIGRHLRARSEDRLHALDLQGPSRRAYGHLGRPGRSRQRADGLCDLFRGRASARLWRRRRDGQGALGTQGRRPSRPRARRAHPRCTRAGSTS